MDRNASATIDGKTFAIGILSVTACVLFVGFMLTTMQPAQAIGHSDRAGDYKMLTMQVSRTKEDVVILDAAAKRTIIYDFDQGTRALEIATLIPLDQLPKPREPDPGQQVPAGVRRRP
ncbi:MAG: hypothetical protein KAY37_05985 [Phycisphaerae bacterium]|nr:hypothetical protein [Phycisphaerae bacterium]